MNTSAPTPIHIDSPNQLAVAVPYLLGYQPGNELVAIGYHDGDIRVTSRITADEVRRFGYDCTAWRMASNGATSVHLIAYGPAAEADAAVFTARDACTRKNLDIYEALRIHDGCWWSYRTPDAPAAPIATDADLSERLEAVYGTPAPDTNLTEVGLEPVTGPPAEAIREAITKAETRLAAKRDHDGNTSEFVNDAMHFVASLANTSRYPDVDEDTAEAIREAITKATTRLSAKRRQNSEVEFMYNALRLVEKLTRTGHYPDIHQTAAIAVYLTMNDIDTAIEEMSVQIINHGDEQTSMMLWTWLSARVPEETRWRTAALAAYAAWISDHTVLATEAAKLSLSLRPTDNKIATTVHNAITHGISVNDDNAADYAISYDED